MDYFDIKTHYDSAYANRIDWENDSMRKYRFQKISTYIQEKLMGKNGEILDYGAWDWLLSKYLPDSYHYNYLDIANNQIKNLREKSISIFEFNEWFQIPDFKKTFDVIVLSEVIEHLPDVFVVISNLKKVLNTDWIIICTTPNCYYWVSILKWIVWKYIDPSNEHVNLYDYSTLINIFSSANYKIIHNDVIFFSYRLFNKFPKIDKIMSKIFKNASLDLFQVYKKND